MNAFIKRIEVPWLCSTRACVIQWYWRAEFLVCKVSSIHYHQKIDFHCLHITMRIWHWKSYWKTRVTLKIVRTKDTSNIHFSDGLQDLTFLNNNRWHVLVWLKKKFQCYYLLKRLSTWFQCFFSVVGLFSVIFSVIFLCW